MSPSHQVSLIKETTTDTSTQSKAGKILNTPAYSKPALGHRKGIGVIFYKDCQPRGGMEFMGNRSPSPACKVRGRPEYSSGIRINPPRSCNAYGCDAEPGFLCDLNSALSNI